MTQAYIVIAEFFNFFKNNWLLIKDGFLVMSILLNIYFLVLNISRSRDIRKLEKYDAEAELEKKEGERNKLITDSLSFGRAYRRIGLDTKEEADEHDLKIKYLDADIKKLKKILKKKD